MIKSRIPGIQSLINKTVLELESELSRLGKPIAADAGVRLCILFCPSFCITRYQDLITVLVQGKLYSIMEICRLFDQIFKEHLDGVYVLAFFFAANVYKFKP